MTINEKLRQTSTENLLDIPMPITVADALEMGFKKSDIVYRLIGNRKFSCILVKGTQEQHDTWIREFDRERKAGDRKRRCLIPDRRGGQIMCPEKNKCRECKQQGAMNFNNGRALSFDKLTEGDDDGDRTYEPASKHSVSEEAIALSMLAELIEHLSSFKDKKYAQIFQMLFDEQTVTEIAKELNIPWSTAKDQVKKVRGLAQSYLKL